MSLSNSCRSVLNVAGQETSKVTATAFNTLCFYFWEQ